MKKEMIDKKELLIILKKGSLSKYGYKLKNSFEKRKKAILYALFRYGSLVVLKKLVILRTLMKNKESLFNKLDKDVKFVQKLMADNKKSLELFKKSLKN